VELTNYGELTDLVAKLTAKQLLFWQTYQKCGVAAEAYKTAYPTSVSWTPLALAKEAHELLNSPKIARIRQLLAEVVVDDVVMDARQVLREWVDLATADPNELVRHVHWNCRHCNGVGGQYQWRHEDEWAAAAADAIQKEKPPPSNAGGYGFKRNNPLNVECLHCDGLGIGHDLIADTTKLTGKARKLYAGIKRTKDGLQVLMRDQDGALVNIARHLGMFQDNINLKGLVAHVDVPLNDEQRQLISKALRDAVS